VPRKTRIQIVGRIERREAEERRRELQELAAELHLQWRNRATQHEELAAEESEERVIPDLAELGRPGA
jgi:hypothetical protein